MAGQGLGLGEGGGARGDGWWPWVGVMAGQGLGLGEGVCARGDGWRRVIARQLCVCGGCWMLAVIDGLWPPHLLAATPGLRPHGSCTQCMGGGAVACSPVCVTCRDIVIRLKKGHSLRKALQVPKQEWPGAVVAGTKTRVAW